VSPDFLAQHYFPRVKRLSDAYHQHGMKVFYHSEGNLWPLMDDLVATGVDGLNPLEPHSGMDLEAVRDRYGKLALWGGVDNSYLLVRGAPDDVRRRVRELIRLGGHGGILIGSTGQIHPACRRENLLAMIETVLGQKARGGKGGSRE
jgi:uroporphyrinogen decarboxylase